MTAYSNRAIVSGGGRTAWSADRYPSDFDASKAVNLLVEESQIAYRSFVQWSHMKADHRNVKAQFDVVKEQGRVFNDTLMLSVLVSEQGRRLADDAAFMCVKFQRGNRFDHMVLLNGMIERAKKGADLARGIKIRFIDIRKTLVEVYAANPDIVNKIEADLTANTRKLEKVIRKCDSNLQRPPFFRFTATMDLKTKEKTEAMQQSLSSDKTNCQSLAGLEGVIDAVSILVDWWDDNVQRLEKIRDDGVDADSNRDLNPFVAERIEYWQVISKQYMWYTSRIKELSDIFEAKLRQ